jgi:hypothetical protein
MQHKTDLSLDEIVSRIIDAILEERIFSREELHKRIRPILKIWLKCTDMPKITSTQVLPKHIKTIESRRITAEYWRDKYKKVVTHDEMVKCYNEVNEIIADFQKQFNQP